MIYYSTTSTVLPNYSVRLFHYFYMIILYVIRMIVFTRKCLTWWRQPSSKLNSLTTQRNCRSALLSASSIPNFKNKQIKSTHKLSLSLFPSLSPLPLHWTQVLCSDNLNSTQPTNNSTYFKLFFCFSSASSNHYHHHYFIIFSLFISKKKVSSQIPIMLKKCYYGCLNKLVDSPPAHCFFLFFFFLIPFETQQNT